MKKYLFLFVILALSLSSCNLDDSNSNDFYFEVRPIESVEVPEQFVQGETYEIAVTYTKPTNCYVFNNIVFDINGNERTVAVWNTVYPNGNCIEDPEEETVSFDLTIFGSETYLFRFYQGKDEHGVDRYHLVEVPVVSGRFFSDK